MKRYKLTNQYMHTYGGYQWALILIMNVKLKARIERIEKMIDK